MTANVSRIKIKNMHKRTFHILMHFYRIEDVGTYIHRRLSEAGTGFHANA